MPKKESAKDRAAAKAEEQAAGAAKAAEDAAWRDDTLEKKGSKKEKIPAVAAGAHPAEVDALRKVPQMSAEEKRLDDLRRKQERDQLEAEEAASLAPAPKAAAKKTQFEINKAKGMMFIPPPSKKKANVKKQDPVEANVNHAIRDAALEAAAAGVDVKTASGVDDATNLLKNLRTGEEPAVDAHPERRRKAAFKDYEEREIPRIREENPGLKLSQIKEIIFKNWQKSPENPMNEAQLAAAGPPGFP